MRADGEDWWAEHERGLRSYSAAFTPGGLALSQAISGCSLSLRDVEAAVRGAFSELLANTPADAQYANCASAASLFRAWERSGARPNIVYGDFVTEMSWPGEHHSEPDIGPARSNFAGPLFTYNWWRAGIVDRSPDQMRYGPWRTRLYADSRALGCQDMYR